MNEVYAVAASAGGRLMLLGCAGGIQAYALCPTEPLRKILPDPRGAAMVSTASSTSVAAPLSPLFPSNHPPQPSPPQRGCLSVGGPVRVLAVLGETPLVAFVLDGSPSTRMSAAPESIPPPHPQPKPKEAEAAPLPSTSRVLRLYDLSEQKVIAELHFKTAIVGVRLNSFHLAVALEDALHVFDLHTLKPLAKLRTTAPPNPRGLMDLSDPTTNVRGEAVSYLAVPQSDQKKGDVSVTQLPLERPEAVERVAIVKAHESGVVCLSMTRDGTRLATASPHGTTVKVFEPSTARLLFVLRRGLRRARVLTLAFDMTGRRLAALSQCGTLHLFRCDATGAASAAGRDGAKARSFLQVTLKAEEAAGGACFFSEDGRCVWVVLRETEGAEGGWALKQYAVSALRCELISERSIT